MEKKPTNAVGVILAGGESKRMGRDKAWLEVGGRLLIHAVTAALRAEFDELIVVANRSERYASLPARVVPDREPGRGPLMGIYSALKTCNADYAFVCACDMIFVEPQFIRFLVRIAADYDFVMPGIVEQKRFEPLHAVYGRACLPVMEALYREKGTNPGPLDLPARVRTRIVAPDEFAPYDPNGLSFINLNSPGDLACAELLWRYYIDGKKSKD